MNIVNRTPKIFNQFLVTYTKRFHDHKPHKTGETINQLWSEVKYFIIANNVENKALTILLFV